VAGIPELLDGGRHGILVPPKDVLTLADAIQRLLANDALRCRYANAARKYAERRFNIWSNGFKLAKVLIKKNDKHK
jgi:glycosyltransferase involved in cell wall biosynthesis